jgi:hypothetical protein
MKPIRWRLIFLAASVLVVIVLGVLLATAPKHPVALIRVVDTTGKPIGGAIILPEGLRTKPGPYRSGWYGWMADRNGVPNPAVTTDKHGFARIPYPKFVFERIETGTLCLSVNHSDFVPERPEPIVATALPAGAPWRARAQDLWDRIRHKALLVRPPPVALQKGAILKISAQSATASTNGGLFAQVSGVASEDTNFWILPEPGSIITRRLAAGPHTVRAVRVDEDGSAWFSDVAQITAVASQTNELHFTLKSGVTVRGQLDATVPRPVKNGRVVAHVWPQGFKPADGPPQWHTWSSVKEDGSYTIKSLPEGELEIVALCDGFISTNGPGQFKMRYPQEHLIGTNDLSVTIGMEPTARLEVTVTDDQGKPLKGAQVMTWPNVRYGEWSATIFAGDCYNTADWLLSKRRAEFSWGQPVLDFQGVSGDDGVAILANLPADVNELSIEHAEFTLPIIQGPGGQKHRQASVTLIAGRTNQLTLQLEPRERSAITHY